MDVRAAVREVVRLGDRGNPPPSTWADLLTASGLDTEQATSLPGRLGLSFHLGAYDEDAVTAQLRQWADALRVRGMPNEAARLDAAVETLAADPTAGPEPEPVSQPEVAQPDPEPASQPGPEPVSQPEVAQPDPEPASQPDPEPEPISPVVRPAAAARTPLSSVRPSAGPPRSPSGAAPTGSWTPSAPGTPFRRSVLVWALVLVLGGPLLLGLLGVLSSGDSGSDGVTTWTPPTVAGVAEGPDDAGAGAPAEPDDLPESRSARIAESEALGEPAVDRRLAAEADRVVAAWEQAAQQLGVQLGAPTRKQDRYSCDLRTANGVLLHVSTLRVETVGVDEATALALISALPDPDPADGEESLPHQRLDGTMTRTDGFWFGDSRGRPSVTQGGRDASWYPGERSGPGVSVDIRSPCHLLEADRRETAAGAAQVPALEQPWVRSAEGGPTVVEVEQWWGTASKAVPGAVEAGARAAGVELTLVEVGPRTTAVCLGAVDEGGVPFHGRSTAWASRQPLTEDQARAVWTHVEDLAPDVPGPEDPGARAEGGTRVQGLEGRSERRHLGFAYSYLSRAFGPDGAGQLRLSLESPCGAG